MPQSRKRHGHQHHKPAAIPARQRTRGKIVWAILFGVFGLVMALFASDSSVVAMIAGAVIGSGLGYLVGRNLDQEASG